MTPTKPNKSISNGSGSDREDNRATCLVMPSSLRVDLKVYAENTHTSMSNVVEERWLNLAVKLILGALDFGIILTVAWV